MSEKEDKFYSNAIDMLDSMKKMIVEKKLRGYAIVVCEAGVGIRTDFQTIDRGPQMALLGGTSLLNHDMMCTMESQARADSIGAAVEEVVDILMTPPKSSMN